MSRILHIAAAQMGPIAREESRSEVVARQIALLREAHALGAELVVFPELALTTFFPRWHLTDPTEIESCLLYTSPSPRDKRQSRMPSSA